MRLPKLLLIPSFFLLSGCSTTALVPKFKGSLFLINHIPKEHCTQELWQYGIYRKLKNGDKEYLPFCDPLISEYVVSHYTDVELVEDIPANK